MQMHFKNIGFTIVNDILLSGICHCYKPGKRDSIYQRPFYIWP
jgi:hypothetical protein